MPRRKTERTAHLKPFCYTCNNTGLVPGLPIQRKGYTDQTSMKCPDCPKAYPTSADAVDESPKVDGQSRAAGEKE